MRNNIAGKLFFVFLSLMLVVVNAHADYLINNVVTGTQPSAVAVGSYPLAVAVNPVTNKIYVVNCGFANLTCLGTGNGNVTVIDGETNSTTTITAGRGAR